MQVASSHGLLRNRQRVYCTYRTGQQQGLRLCSTAGCIRNGEITVAVDRKYRQAQENRQRGSSVSGSRML